MLVVLGVLLAGIFVLELMPEMRESFKETTGLAEVERSAEARREAAALIEERSVEVGQDAFWRRGVNAVSVTAIPFLFAIFIGYAAVRGVKVYEEFVTGAKEGFGVALRVMPYMVAMLVALGMLRDSGALMLLQVVIAPVMDAVGFPPDLLPMALMRPLSGEWVTGGVGGDPRGWIDPRVDQVYRGDHVRIDGDDLLRARRVFRLGGGCAGRGTRWLLGWWPIRSA